MLIFRRGTAHEGFAKTAQKLLKVPKLHRAVLSAGIPSFVGICKGMRHVNYKFLTECILYDLMILLAQLVLEVKDNGWKRSIKTSIQMLMDIFICSHFGSSV